MIYKEIPIQVEGSDKTSRAQFYILDTLPDEMKIQKRPIILICPGGGYHKVSYREGEPLAMHFLSLGYHACVLQYSVSPEAFYPTQLLEVTESVRQIHEHAKEWYIDTKKIVLAGASAGGHLAANYCAFWKREFFGGEKWYAKRDVKAKRPDPLLSGYHIGSEICAYAKLPESSWRYSRGRGLELIFGSSDYRFHAALFYLAYSNRSDSTAAEFFAACHGIMESRHSGGAACVSGRDSWTQPCQ